MIEKGVPEISKLKKVIWLVSMACLCVALYSVVISRKDASLQDVIFGGSDSVYVGMEKVSRHDPNAEVIVEDDGLDWPEIDEDEIALPQYTVVNADNLLSSAYAPDLACEPVLDKEGNPTFDEKGNPVTKTIPIYGTRYQMFEATAKPYLDKMLADMEEAGFTPYIASSYRTYSYQSQLFNTKATGIYMEMGYAAADWASEEYQMAAEMAKKYTAQPGASEHQLALAVDIWDRQRQRLNSYTDLDENFRNWLENHSWEYGFIQRYPTKKCLLTGWDEPWHYRYVGVKAAKFIKENDICYEEFYQHYVPNFKF